MKLSQLFKSSKDFQLDKRTFINLRWIAFFGQFITINIVRYILDFEFDYLISNIIIFCGVLTNFFLQFKIKQNQLSNYSSATFLAFDIIQLGALLFLTGGITNPFIFLIIIPSVFSSTYLKLISTLFLTVLTILIIILLTFFHADLPGLAVNNIYLGVPDYYLYSIPFGLVLGLLFLVYFGAKFGEEAKKRQEILNNIQLVMAKEHELLSLGGQAAAAAHSLGTPLSTISLIAKELKEEVKNSEKSKKDIDLLISQSDRCNEILKKFSMNPHVEDNFIDSESSFYEYLSEIIRSYEQITKKKFILNDKNNKNSIKFYKSIEIIYGLRNFIGNANKFAKDKIEIKLISNSKITEIQIIDDGPGFPKDIIKQLGEPYIRSSYQQHKTKMGLGLGTFIGKTLLEKNFAKINFDNCANIDGAVVTITWQNSDLKEI